MKVNPAVFIDRVGDAINQALYDQAAEGIVYTPIGRRSLDGRALQERAPGRDGRQAGVVVSVQKSITDKIVCDSGVEVRLAEYLEARDDVPLFIKLPGWF